MNGYYPDLPEEERLQNLLVAIDQHPGNYWWENQRQPALERLDFLYELEFGAEFRESMDWFQEQQDLLITM